MAWNTDKTPIDYLKQRIKYYKKKRSTVNNLNRDDYIVDRYGGKENLEFIIKERIEEIDDLIEMYEDAVLNLETIEEVENRVNNQQSFKKE